MDTNHTCTHTHTKPPSGQGLTLTLKGLCLAPVISTPQAGYVVSISTSLPVCVYERVCRSTIYGVNSCRHPRHLMLIVTWVRAFVCALGFVYVGTTEKQQQFHRQCSENRNNRAFDGWFVCSGAQTGNEIMLRARGVRARGLWKSRAGPGGEYQSLIRRPRWAYGNEGFSR